MSTGRGTAKRVAAILLLIVAAALLFAGCGGGSSSTSSSSASGSTTTTSDNGGGAEPSKQFLKPKGKNEIAEFGSEASAEEREAASEVVEESLKAREDADFATQCETLSLKGVKEVPGTKSRAECPKTLKSFAEPLAESKEARKDTLSGPIDAMRVKGEKGYALYHGTDKKNYAVPLEKEDGAWLVASVNTEEI
jgi:hypothetical protein